MLSGGNIEWVDCDNDISTVGNLTDAETIQLAQSENCNNEDEDDTVTQKPSVTEVRMALKCLQDFSLCSQLKDSSVLDDITALEKQLNNVIATMPSSTKESNWVFSASITVVTFLNMQNMQEYLLAENKFLL